MKRSFEELKAASNQALPMLHEPSSAPGQGHGSNLVLPNLSASLSGAADIPVTLGSINVPPVTVPAVPPLPTPPLPVSTIRSSAPSLDPALIRPISPVPNHHSTPTSSAPLQTGAPLVPSVTAAVGRNVAVCGAIAVHGAPSSSLSQELSNSSMFWKAERYSIYMWVRGCVCACV